MYKIIPFKQHDNIKNINNKIFDVAFFTSLWTTYEQRFFACFLYIRINLLSLRNHYLAFWKFGYTVSKYHRSVLKYSQDLFQEHPRSESSILVRKSQWVFMTRGCWGGGRLSLMKFWNSVKLLKYKLHKFLSTSFTFL